jgi:teichuronic acid biosynthesis glycosyltransferase TuaG
MNSIVSVVMPAHNAKRTIEASIRSVLEQTYVHLELLVYDDGSTDGSLALINQFEKVDNRVKVLRSSKNRGVVRARNLCIRLAKGDFVAFCDADDQWIPEKLEMQLRLMAATNATFSYSSVIYVYPADKWRSKPANFPSKITYKRLLQGNPIGLSTAIFNSNLLGKFYFEKLPFPLVHEDYAYWVKLFKQKNPIAVYYSIPSVFVDINTNTRSGNKWLAMRSQFYILRNTAGLSNWKTILNVCTYLLFALHKRGLRTWAKQLTGSAKNV